MFLSRREKQTLELLLRAYPDKEIANTLGVATRTVKQNLQSMYKKFNIDRVGNAGGCFPRIRLAVLAHEARESLGIECAHCLKADSVPATSVGAC